MKFVNDDTHKNYASPFSISVESDVWSGVTVMILYTGDNAEETVTIHIAKLVGVDTNAIAINDNSATLTTTARMLTNGTFEYATTYEKTFTKASEVSVYLNDINANATVTVNGEEYVGGAIVLEVPANGVITIVITGTDVSQTANVSFSVAPIVAE